MFTLLISSLDRYGLSTYVIPLYASETRKSNEQKSTPLATSILRAPPQIVILLENISNLKRIPLIPVRGGLA